MPHTFTRTLPRKSAQNATHNSAHFAWFDSVLSDLLWCEEVNMGENTDVENMDGKPKDKFGMIYESEEEEMSEENKTFLKKRMCTFCDKIFRGVTQRHIHEKTMHCN